MTALCLRGEREWLQAPARPPRFALESADALAFISSNAATLGEAALTCHDLDELLRAAIFQTAALSAARLGTLVEPRFTGLAPFLAAVRALRLRGIRPAPGPLAEAFDLATGTLPADTADRPLDGDLAHADRLLTALAALASGVNSRP